MLRVLIFIGAASLVLTVLRLALAILLFIYLAMLIIGIFTRPKETIGLLAIFVLLSSLGR